MAKSSKEDIFKDEQRILDKLKKNANKSINEMRHFVTTGFQKRFVWVIIAIQIHWKKDKKQNSGYNKNTIKIFDLFKSSLNYLVL